MRDKKSEMRDKKNARCELKKCEMRNRKRQACNLTCDFAISNLVARAICKHQFWGCVLQQTKRQAKQPCLIFRPWEVGVWGAFSVNFCLIRLLNCCYSCFCLDHPRARSFETSCYMGLSLSARSKKKLDSMTSERSETVRQVGCMTAYFDRKLSASFCKWGCLTHEVLRDQSLFITRGEGWGE